MKRLVLPIILSLLCPAAGFAFEVGIKGAYWIPDFSGNFRLDSGDVEGTRVSLDDDLGIGDENFLFGEAWIGVGRHHLTFSAIRVDYSGDETLSEAIVFGGTTFVAAGNVESDLEYTMLDLAYQFDLLDLENILAGFSVGPIVQVRYFDGDVEMSGEGQLNGATGQLKESESFQIPVPLLGLGTHVGVLVDMLEVRARIVGMKYKNDWLYDLQAEVNYSPFPFVEIVGGYRHFDIDVDEDDVLLDYTQTGPYVGAAVKI